MGLKLDETQIIRMPELEARVGLAIGPIAVRLDQRAGAWLLTADCEVRADRDLARDAHVVLVAYDAEGDPEWLGVCQVIAPFAARFTTLSIARYLDEPPSVVRLYPEFMYDDAPA